MKFSKLAICSLFIMGSLAISSTASSRTVTPVLDARNLPVQDHKGNCVRTKWLAEQCCDVCGFPEPAAPEVVETAKKVTYVDLVRQSIYFDIDKDNIDATDEARIQDVINEINKSVAIRDVKLVGYADRFATNKYNIALSKRRATHVLDNIRAKGYLNNNTIGFGYFGEEKPVTQCPMNVAIPQQVACLQADRRVDIELELLRERTETVKEVVNNMDKMPAYPRPGTSGVEVYSRPVDPKSVNFSAPSNPAPATSGPSTMPVVPVAPVSSAPMNAPQQLPASLAPAGYMAPAASSQNIDVLGNR